MGQTRTRASDKLKQKQEIRGPLEASIILRRIYKTLRCVYYYYDTLGEILVATCTGCIQMFSGAMLHAFLLALTRCGDFILKYSVNCQKVSKTRKKSFEKFDLLTSKIRKNKIFGKYKFFTSENLPLSI